MNWAPEAHDANGHLDPEQTAFEEEYLAWAARVLVQRRKVYGDDFGPRSQGTTPPALATFNAALAEGVNAFLSSASRSPLRNWFVTLVAPKDPVSPQPGELSFDYDLNIMGGMAGGVGSDLYEKVVKPAIEEVLKKHNVPMLEPVHPAVLFPDPCRVQLVVLEGPDGAPVKYYYRAATDREPPSRLGSRATASTLPELQKRMADKRWFVEIWQQFNQENALGAFLQPYLTGGSNTARRMGQTVEALQNPGQVWIGSVMASGSAGAAAKFLLQLAQAPITVSVPDMLGGQQRLNACTMRGRSDDPGRPLGGFSAPDSAGPLAVATWIGDNALGVIHGVGEAGVGMAYNLGRLLRYGWHPRAIADLVFRHILPNMGASVTAAGYAVFTAALLRNKHLGPFVGEHPHSGANALQQAAQSFINDFTWPAYRAIMEPFKWDPAKVHSERRKIDAAKLQRNHARLEIQLMELQTDLREQLDAWLNFNPKLADGYRNRLEYLKRPAEARLLNAAEVRDMLGAIDPGRELSRHRGNAPETRAPEPQEQHELQEQHETREQEGQARAAAQEREADARKILVRTLMLMAGALEQRDRIESKI